MSPNLTRSIFTFGCIPEVTCNAKFFSPTVSSALFQHPKIFPLLLLPALAQLSYTYTHTEIARPKNFANLSDPKSLPTLLRAGSFDTINEQITLNPDRWPVMAFSYPFGFSALYLGMQRPEAVRDETTLEFLLQPFDSASWIVTAAFALILIVLTMVVSRPRTRFRLTSDAVFDVFVGVMSAFYAAKFLARSVQAPFLETAPNFEFLTKMVATDRYTLVTTTVDDFRFEFLNASTLPDVRRFGAALAANPPRVVNQSALCEFLMQSNESKAYFLIDTEGNILTRCADQLEKRRLKLLLLSIPGAPPVMTGMIFSPEANKVRKVVSEFVLHGVFRTEKCRIARAQKAAGIEIYYDDEPLKENSEVFDSAHIMKSFWPLLIGLAISTVVFVLEIKGEN